MEGFFFLRGYVFFALVPTGFGKNILQKLQSATAEVDCLTT